MLGALLPLVVLGATLQWPSLTAGAEASPGPPALGVYAGWEQGAAIQQLGSYLGERPRYAMDFLSGATWSQLLDSSASFPPYWNSSGYRMIWGVPMLPDTFQPGTAPCTESAADQDSTQSSACGLAEGAQGDFDSTFVKVASNLVAAGQGDAIVRLGWEFNGGWFPWAANGSAANFAAFYRQIVRSMRSVPGAHFAFEWNPSLGNLWVGDLADYYPGNHYVDLVGLDVYDSAWAYYPGEPTEFATLESEPFGLDWLAAFAAEHRKPIVIPEWGLGWGPSAPGSGPVTAPGQETSGGDDPAFVSDMARWISSHDVLEATFWDYQDLPGGGASQDVLVSGDNPHTATALRQSFGLDGIAAGPAPAVLAHGHVPTVPPVLVWPSTATFTASQHSSVEVDAVGNPRPRLHAAASLPPGLRLSQNGRLAGAPLAGSGGAYTVEVVARNGVAPKTAAPLEVTINEPPVVSSPSQASCVAGAWCDITVTVRAEPTLSSLEESGALPPGLSWGANLWSGQATISGFAAPSASGSYPIELSAVNALGAAHSALELTVAS